MTSNYPATTALTDTELPRVPRLWRNGTQRSGPSAVSPRPPALLLPVQRRGEPPRSVERALPRVQSRLHRPEACPSSTPTHPPPPPTTTQAPTLPTPSTRQ